MTRMLVAVLLLSICVFSLTCCRAQESGSGVPELPGPKLTSTVTVEKALEQRRSVRTYANEPLTLQQISNLLWAAQGITEPKRGLRTAPSAVASYPLKVYLVAGNVTGLSAGVYLYVPQGHKLELVRAGDVRAQVGRQPQMQTAPALFLYAADYAVTKPRFGASTAERFAYIEAGHSAQNILLEEVALGLAGVPMAGYDPRAVKSLLNLGADEEPIYLVSAGKRGPAPTR